MIPSLLLALGRPLLRLRYRIPGRVIPQELIDDLIVLERHGGSRELLTMEEG